MMQCNYFNGYLVSAETSCLVVVVDHIIRIFCIDW